MYIPVLQRLQLGAEEDILSHLRLHFVCTDYSNFILI